MPAQSLSPHNATFPPAPVQSDLPGAGLRVLLVSKALVVGAYQRKAEELAALGVSLTVVTPPEWGDARGVQRLERLYTSGYRLQALPVRFGGNYHLHYYPGLPALLRNLRPDLLHMDEEPYNFATWHALRSARNLGIAATFFTWQNLLRTYPPPFRQMESAVYGWTPLALAGSLEAAEVLKRKGYAGETAVFPQFGVDEALYSPAGRAPAREALRVGYAGGLLPEKGIDLLLRACARLPGAWSLEVIGGGSEEAALEALARALGIEQRVRFVGRLPSAEMPAALRGLDVLVLPSRTRSNWKEQFGRVLIESMACGTVVVGSDSGEIPQVIGEAGLIFAEEDVDALAAQLVRLQAEPTLRAGLAAAGRARVLACFTMRHIAQQTVAAWRRLLEGARHAAKPHGGRP